MRRVFLFVPIALFIAACGGNGSPTFPFGGTATISGSVVGSAGGSSSTAGSASAGTTVSAVGGNSTDTIDTSGRFNLRNVRAGDNVELRFRGTGLDLRVALGQIEGAEDVTVRIVRDGQTLKLESIHRHGHDKVE